MGLLDSITGNVVPDPTASQPQDNGQAAYTYFVNQGLAPHQAAGIVGNLQGESGQGLNPNAVNKGDGRDGSDSIGIGQWNGTRAQALRDYAASKGTDWNDLNTQLEFLHSELKGPESKAYGRLAAAQTPEEAGQAMLAYERPKDWNRPGAHPERAQYATRAFAQYGGQPVAPNGASAPLPSPAATQPASPAAPANSPLLPASGQPQAPIFAAPQAQPMAMAQMPAPQMPPIFVPPRKPVDLSMLRQALAQRAPVFPQG